MERVRVNGRTYSDPDVLSLIRSDSHPVDPQLEVVRRARALNRKLRNFGEVPEPRRRLEILASLAGIKVAPMDGPGTVRNGREALIYRDSDGSRRAFYDPTNSDGRVNFSIAHEIVHTFFPNSANGGRFRSICADDSKEANELEMLCHRGAAELLMPVEEFSEELNEKMGISEVPRICQRFGSSYEATVYRMATVYSRVAVAGLLRYRYRKDDERRLASINQHLLFGEADERATPLPMLRRQTIHTADRADSRHWVPWNKSFNEGSCVYRAALEPGVHHSWEQLPNQCPEIGEIEAVRAPFQRPGNNPERPDVLFLWWKSNC